MNTWTNQPVKLSGSQAPRDDVARGQSNSTLKRLWRMLTACFGWLVRLLWAFWVHPVRAEPLALFRILVGTCLLLSISTDLLPRLWLDFGEDGLSQVKALGNWPERTNRFSIFRGPGELRIEEKLKLSEWYPAEWEERRQRYAEDWQKWAEQPDVVVGLLIAWMLSLMLMTVGLFTRLATIAAWFLTVSFHVRLPWTLNGGDSLFRCALFYLMFAQAGAIWSVDHLRRQRRQARLGRQGEEGPVTVSAWPIRLMQIQLCTIYLFTGLYKLGSDWFTGEAVYWVLNDIELTRWPYGRFPVPMFLCRLLSWGTLVFEIGFPILVLFRWTRPWVLLVGVSFHLSILATMEIGWFSQVSMSWYVLFLSGPSVVWMVHGLGRVLVPGGRDKPPLTTDGVEPSLEGPALSRKDSRCASNQVR